MKVISLFCLSATAVADPSSTPMLKVALAPASRPLADVSTLLAGGVSQEQKLFSEGLNKVDESYKSALSSATAQIQQVIAQHFARSFLQAPSNAVRVSVATSPSVAHRNLAKLRNIYATLDGVEARQFKLHAHEFDAITKAVVNTLRASLSGESFLQSERLAIPGQSDGLGDLNVRVGVPRVPFPRVEDLMQASVENSVSGSSTAAAKILDRQREFVRSLNSVIRATLQKYA